MDTQFRELNIDPSNRIQQIAYNHWCFESALKCYIARKLRLFCIFNKKNFFFTQKSLYLTLILLLLFCFTTMYVLSLNVNSQQTYGFLTHSI